MASITIAVPDNAPRHEVADYLASIARDVVGGYTGGRETVPSGSPRYSWNYNHKNPAWD
jgi:hypothetical protein